MRQSGRTTIWPCASNSREEGALARVCAKVLGTEQSESPEHLQGPKSRTEWAQQNTLTSSQWQHLRDRRPVEGTVYSWQRSGHLSDLQHSHQCLTELRQLSKMKFLLHSPVNHPPHVIWKSHAVCPWVRLLSKTGITKYLYIIVAGLCINTSWVSWVKKTPPPNFQHFPIMASYVLSKNKSILDSYISPQDPTAS